ncbi:O-antigen ligase family protein [Qipengyuania aquimaris]|uniref:O-antigen ligase family protein n=1 Tax=Qipengyuania aquimaris TaxID=255984 RepID=UPI001FD08562|nr:hypothetical protein [Qipengyuania aquimaris]UOR15182.1 hypothetical protein LCM05_11945 [Qipengyuania aquimaris]
MQPRGEDQPIASPLAESAHATSIAPITAAPIFGQMVLLAAFFISWNLARPPSLNLTVSDAAFGLVAVLLLFSNRLKIAVFGRFTAFWLLGVALLIGGLLIGSAVNGVMLRWFVVGGQYFLALALVPAVLSSMSERVLQRAALAYVFGVALSQLIGVIVIQFFTYDELSGVLGPTFLMGNGRLGSLSGEPNSNGAQCVFAMILLVHATLARRLPAFIAIPTGAILFAGMFSSASFTSFMACGLALAILLIFTNFNVIAKVVLPIILIGYAYIAAGGPIPEIFLERVAGAFLNMDLAQAGTFTGRVELVGEAWRMADDNLLVGLGVDRFREVSTFGAPVHNFTLLVLNEGGLFSFIGAISLVFCMVAASFDTLRRHRLNGALCLAMTTVFVIYTTSIAHMYDRIWSAPLLLAFALSLSPLIVAIRTYSGPPSYSAPRGAGLSA